MTYATLQTEISDYLNRTDLTDKIPTFIGIAEAFMFREIRVKAIEVSVTGSTVSGYAAIPADFGSLSRVTMSSNGKTYNLDYLSAPTETSTVEAMPGFYSFENGQIRIWGTGTGSAYTLVYVPAVAALSISNTTNWLLTNAHDLYLYASCLEGARYLRDAGEVASLTQVVSTLVNSVRSTVDGMAFPVTGSMQIRTRG
jgi:hypothetical protein